MNAYRRRVGGECDGGGNDYQSVVGCEGRHAVRRNDHRVAVAVVCGADRRLVIPVGTVIEGLGKQETESTSKRVQCKRKREIDVDAT